MPKVGQEPIRRAALVAATIEVIGEAGSLDVTVSQIAKRAGMSSALAHHYFGSKAQIFLAAMRQILTDYGQDVRAALQDAAPEARLEALIAVNLDPSHFQPATISAWLNFYVLAQRDPDAARLLRIYQGRLRSNLIHALRGRTATPEATADTLGALIDGVYLRAALGGAGIGDAQAQVLSVAQALLTPEAQ
ncbi:transcriptional regulator BetI [Tropicibacter naphthalenivorans]|uniref:HTH-type transcriptional regulator BetI n=1 Tax=Tropicibacter naphthalenivorans TaxID=441103 RepID=A0A0P1G2Z0_9RHOB|nr:transcriptional regulator BetI [Tropicibacter naphthalenivorans]CUH76190.1 Rut operon repressor [Tropicibacter naphthalenivorans]SMC39464.1 transcriptional regulator, TetR family [Tropicibacter naphthalenivorans]